MGAPEKSGKMEYSNREVLREIFMKFKELRKTIPLGATAHLVIDSKLANNLKIRLNAKKIGYSQEMLMQAKVVTYLKLGIPNASAIKLINGELFTLFAGDKGVLPLSCISLSLSGLTVEGDANHSIYLAQLDKEGVFNIKAQTTLEKI